MSGDGLGYESLDTELRRQLRDAAPEAGDTDATLRALTPRFDRARHRHRIAVVGGSMVSAMVIVLAGAVALGSGSGSDRGVQVPPANRPASGHQQSTTSTTTATDGAAGGTDGAAAADGSTAAAADAGTTPSTATGASDDAAPGAPVASPVRRTFDSAGGSVTVELADGALTIVSTAPASGYAQEIHDNGPSRVEVRFTDGSGEWRVRVDLVDGQMVEEITQH